MSPDADGLNDILIVSCKGFSKEMLNIERWSLTVYKTGEYTSVPVLSYAGGGTPPSSIKIEGRDSSGNLLPSGKYEIQVIIVDAFNTPVSTPFYHFNLK